MRFFLQVGWVMGWVMGLAGLQGLLAAPGLVPGGTIPAFAGGQRDYAVTAGREHARDSFQAEVTVTLKSGLGGAGCGFFGMGSGVADAGNYGEPTTHPALVFRLAPSDFGGGKLQATLNGQILAEPVTLGDGTHRLRLTWDSNRKLAWLQVHPGWAAGATFAPAITISVSAGTVDFGTEARLFVGGGGGVVFADFSNNPVAAAELEQLPRQDSFASDPSALTWLPVAERPASPAGPVADPLTAPVDAFLNDLPVRLRPVVCWYDGPRLMASRPFVGGQLQMPASKWSLAVDAATVAGESDARDVTLTLTLEDGQSGASGLAAAFDFSAWSGANYVLIPGAVYNGNRYRTSGRGYNAGLDPADYYRKDLSLTQSSVPRLEIESGKPSKLEVNSCNVTTPAICVFDRKTKRGFIVLAEQAGRDAKGGFLRNSAGEILDSVFAVEETADRSRATIVVSAPGVRGMKPEFVGFSSSPDRAIGCRPGDRISLRLRIYSFAAPDLPGLLDRFAAVRKAVTGPNHPRKLVPASQVAQWMGERIESRYHKQPGASFYCPENAAWIAFGWIGGWMNTLPMLASGDDRRLERVTNTFDFGLKAQEPTGYFHYAIDAKGNVTFRDPATDMNLARTSGDMLFWMIKQFHLLKAQGRGGAIKPEWEIAMRKLADALVTTWEMDGQWGKLINVKTGRVGEFNTTGGATIIGALAAAADYYHHPKYMQIAQQAADYYYQRDFVALGQTSGGCADILQNADSETAAGLMASLMTLYETTGDRLWLEKSRNVANLVATWAVSHDYELPKTTELGGLGAKLAGVYWASTQNKHGAPGICTSSGDSLLKIYRATGDVRYADLLRDIVAAHGESIRPGGFTNERLTYCDADSRGSRGGHVTGWNETNGALMALEIPGIYLRTDADRFVVFDAVEAKVLKRGATGVTLEIKNPTPFDAAVSIFAENASQAAKPQGGTAFLRWPKVTVKAGATRTAVVDGAGISVR